MMEEAVMEGNEKRERIRKVVMSEREKERVVLDIFVCASMLLFFFWLSVCACMCVCVCVFCVCW